MKVLYASLSLLLMSILFFAGVALYRSDSSAQVTSGGTVSNPVISLNTSMSAGYGGGGFYLSEDVSGYPSEYPDPRVTPVEEKCIVSADLKSADVQPLVAIIIDDFGWTKESGKLFAEISYPLTWAVVPNTRNAKKILEIAQENGIECIAHVPMQGWGDSPKNMKGPVIKEGLSSEDISAVIDDIIKELPGVIGMNNHRGSLATEKKNIMEPFLREIRDRGLFFVDSMTTSKTVTKGIAAKLGTPWAMNAIFLDNLPTAEEMDKRIDQLIKIAKRRSYAIAIAHARKTTFENLTASISRIEEKGVKLVKLSELMTLLAQKQEAAAMKRDEEDKNTKR